MAAPATHTKFSKASGGRLEWYPVTASAAIKKGDLLKIASSKVDQAIALGSSDGAGEASGGNLDVAAFAEENFTADASGVSTDGQGRTKMLVRVVDDTFRWETRLNNSLSSPAGGSSRQADISLANDYAFMRWRVSATEWWYELYVESTNGEWITQNYSPNSRSTDSFGIVIVKPALAQTVRQLN